MSIFKTRPIKKDNNYNIIRNPSNLFTYGGLDEKNNMAGRPMLGGAEGSLVNLFDVRNIF